MYLSPLPTGGSAWKTVSREGSFWALWAQGAPSSLLIFFPFSQHQDGLIREYAEAGLEHPVGGPALGKPRANSLQGRGYWRQELAKRPDLPLARLLPCQDEG